ncbi:MAG: GGDEF domain-containing protein [Steroidobacteraceae bacterium]|nr:GGDEF domain-containing protein [Steroidobacteraceae bacterium]
MHRFFRSNLARVGGAPLLAALAMACVQIARSQEPQSAQALIERSVLGMRIDPEKSRHDAEAAIALLAGKPNADLEIRARILLCTYYAERDQHAAEEQIERAVALLPQAHRRGLRAGVLTCQGDLHEIAGDNAQAIALYDQAVSVATEAQDDEMLAEALFNRGYLRGVQGKYSAGLTDLRTAQSLFEKRHMPQHAITVLNAIAILYNRLGDYAQAVHIYTRALKGQREAGLRREVAVTLYNLGRAHEKQQQWEFARRAYAESLQIQRELGYARGEAYALRGLAAVANAAGDPRGALDTLKRAQALLGGTTDARLRAHIQLTRGVALHRLGRLEESLAALEDASQIFRDADALGDLSLTYAELARVHAELGNWRAAYETQVKQKSVSDKLLENQLDERFTTLKVEFDTATKEKENALLTRENQANEKALQQERRARQLQAFAIVLTVLLAAMLATLAIHQRRMSQRMRMLALTDELTGVPNRRDVLRRLEDLLQREGEQRCSVLIVDIDHFKSINDHHGHPIGDEVLKFIARELRTAVREPAFFGRLGGEEFLVVLPNTSLENACAAAERYREQIMAIDTTRWFPARRRITASIGVAVSKPGTCTSSDMLMRADDALYAAKRAGRNCVRVAPETPPKEPTDETKIA